MSRKPQKAKEQTIKAVYDKIMAEPDEREQNLLALMIKTYSQGISAGKTLALRKPKTA